MQETRFLTFVKEWKKIRGRQICLGDFNYEWWRLETEQHRRVQKMKQMVLDHILPRGLVQIVREDTRNQGTQKSCLDHIYLNQGQFVERIWNRNISGYDHNCVGVRLKLKNPVFEEKRLKLRNLKKLHSQDFMEEFQQLDHIRREQIGRDAVVTGGKMGEVRYCQAWDESKVRDRGG